MGLKLNPWFFNVCVLLKYLFVHTTHVPTCWKLSNVFTLVFAFESRKISLQYELLMLPKNDFLPCVQIFAFMLLLYYSQTRVGSLNRLCFYLCSSAFLRSSNCITFNIWSGYRRNINRNNIFYLLAPSSFSWGTHKIVYKEHIRNTSFVHPFFTCWWI